MSTDESRDAGMVAVLRRARPPVLSGPGPDLGDVRRAGAARRVRTARVRAAVAASGATAVAVVAVVVGAAAVGGGDPFGDVPAAGSREQAVDGLRLLAGPAGPEDSLPSLGGPSSALMDPATARRVADVDGVAVYAGTDVDGQVCVHVHQQVPGASTSSCRPPAEFEEQGLPFSFGDASSSVAGVLLPDSWAVDGSDQRLSDVTNPGSGLTLDDVVDPNLLLRVTGPSASAGADGRTAQQEPALLARPATVEDRLRAGALRAGDVELGVDDVPAPHLPARGDDRRDRDG